MLKQPVAWAQLLPLTSDGRAALPPGPERECRLQLAILLSARVDYLCPEPPPLLHSLGGQLRAYFSGDEFEGRFAQGFAQADNSGGPTAVQRYLGSYSGSDVLQHVLHLYAAGRTAAAVAQSQRVSDAQSTHSRVACAAMMASALMLLRDSRHQQAIDRGLAALRDSRALQPGQQLLTRRQLAHVCGCQITLAGGYMLIKAAIVEVVAVEFVQRMANMAAEAVLQLEPGNARSLLEAARYFSAAADFMPLEVQAAPPQPAQRVVDLYLRAVRLGQQQGSDWWVARCAPPALLACTPAVSRASKAAVVAAVKLAEPALKRCRPMLPDCWVKAAEGLLARPTNILARVEAELSAGGGMGIRSSGSLSASYGSALTPEEAAKVMRARRLECDGCRKAQYCRRARLLPAVPAHAAIWHAWGLQASLLLPHWRLAGWTAPVGQCQLAGWCVARSGC